MQYSGRTGDMEVASAVRSAQADERFDELLYDIHDFLQCQSYTLFPSMMEELAATDAAAARSLVRHQLAVAVVTNRLDVIASVNAYRSSRLNVHKVKIFSSVQDARAWVSEETGSADKPH